MTDADVGKPLLVARVPSPHDFTPQSIDWRKVAGSLRGFGEQACTREALMRADLPAFIETLRQNREARSESLYASDKVYALLDAYDAVREAADALASQEPVAPAFNPKISDETKAAMDDIDACIRSAAINASTTFFGASPIVPVAAKAEAGVREALQARLDHVDRNTCTHETTHRGGSIWTICDDCGKEWADDRGGFVPYFDPDPVANARTILSAAAPTCEGEGT